MIFDQQYEALGVNGWCNSGCTSDVQQNYGNLNGEHIGK